LFFLLGYTFSPRLKDAGGSRFWRINREAKYGALDEVARHKINTALIALHWEDVLRLVGSLKLGKLKALDAMRVLSRDGHLGGLGKAVQEIGRIAKTLYLLGYVSDEATQRRVHLELQHGETRHSLARATGHGNQGEIRQHYVRGMEAQLGALGFMVNVIVLWNSLYTGAALSMIEAMGDEVLEMDVERLTPLKWAHINMLGRYEFTVSPEVLGGDLRPLRDPNAWLEADLAA
jgi:TnpA family transposase